MPMEWEMEEISLKKILNSWFSMIYKILNSCIVQFVAHTVTVERGTSVLVLSFCNIHNFLLHYE